MLVLLTIQHLKTTKAKRPQTHEAHTMFNENQSNISKFVEENT
jgi:ubiquitin-protein ligase